MAKRLPDFSIQGHSGPSHHEEYDLVGFGININNRSFPADLRDSATSLAEEAGRPLDLHHFALVFLAKLTWNLGLLYFEEINDLRGDGFSGRKGEHRLLERWKELSDTVGRRVIFGHNVFDAPLFEATVIGLQDDGSLMMRLDDGSCLTEQSGEIRYKFQKSESRSRNAEYKDHPPRSFRP